jgi:hypothetical protein
VAAGILAIASPALAVVKREGAWPEADPKVSLDVARVPREEAIRKLADAAGWSVVVHAPQADLVDVHVKDQPAGKVLDLLLLDADYIATRDGTLVSIRRATADAPMPPMPPMPMAAPVPPAPPAPPAPGATASASATAAPSADRPKELGRDVDVSGDDLRIRKNEVVHNVTVIGGKLDVMGKVTGDVKAMGGNVHIHPGARVFGKVVSFGGDIHVDDDGRIDGDVSVVGGALRRGEKAILHGAVKGEVHQISSKGHRADDDNEDEDDDDDSDAAAGPLQRMIASKAAEVGATFARMALLFVFGTVLLALQPERLDALKTELVARPMRSFAMGVIGAIGAAGLFVLLCITVVGIPFAILGGLGAALALAASGCAVLETVGRALVRHRSQNPYVHLGLGCALFLGVSAIPYIGVAVGLVVGLLATGILVSTRGAGLLSKIARGSQPYRTAPI